MASNRSLVGPLQLSAPRVTLGADCVLRTLGDVRMRTWLVEVLASLPPTFHANRAQGGTLYGSSGALTLVADARKFPHQQSGVMRAQNAAFLGDDTQGNGWKLLLGQQLAVRTPHRVRGFHAYRPPPAWGRRHFLLLRSEAGTRRRSG